MEKKILLSLRYITLHQNHKIAIGILVTSSAHRGGPKWFTKFTNRTEPVIEFPNVMSESDRP